MSVLRVVVVDKDDLVRRQWTQWGEGSDFIVQAVGTVLGASRYPADVYVIDITSVASILDPWFAEHPIRFLIDHHPGAEIVLVSGIRRKLVEDVIDSLYRSTGVRARYGGTGGFEAVEQVLRSLDDTGDGEDIQEHRATDAMDSGTEE